MISWRLFQLGLILFCCCWSHLSQAQDVYRRSVGFDWDPVPNSKGYDMEVKLGKEDGASKVFNFSIQENSWDGKLAPGQYIFRVRARDHRNVPGEWSPYNPLVVGLENVKIKQPLTNSKITSRDAKTELVTFSWEPLPAATLYKFELTSEDNKTSVKKELAENKLELELPVAARYTWKISAQSDQDVKSDGTSIAHFVVIGPKLSVPDL